MPKSCHRHTPLMQESEVTRTARIICTSDCTAPVAPVAYSYSPITSQCHGWLSKDPFFAALVMNCCRVPPLHHTYVHPVPPTCNCHHTSMHCLYPIDPPTCIFRPISFDPYLNVWIYPVFLHQLLPGTTPRIPPRTPPRTLTPYSCTLLCTLPQSYLPLYCSPALLLGPFS